MDKKKLITSGVLATVVAVSGQFVQTGTTSGDSFFGLQRAEAGMFSGLADAFKHDATKAVKDGVKEGLNKALDINYDGLNSHRNDMIHHLMLATGSFAASEYKIGVALDRANEGNYQAMGAVANNLNAAMAV